MKKSYILYGGSGILIGIVAVLLINIFFIDKGEHSVNASKIDPTEDKIFFIYSNPFIKKSALISTSQGEKFNKRYFKVPDIPYIQKKAYSSDDIVLLAEHEPYYYTLNNNKIKEHKLSNPFAFWYEGENVSVKAYNVDTNGNELKIKDKQFNKKYSLTLPSLVTMGANDGKYIYVIQSMSIYVIDRKTEEIIKTLGLASYADLFDHSDNYIVASSDHELTVIEKGSWKSKFLKYPDDLEQADAVHYDEKSGKFYVTYINKSGNAGLLEINKDFSVEKFDLKFPYMNAKFKDQKLYVISQEENKKGIGGYMGIFDIRTKKKLKEFNLPEETTKVQDFLILD
ncbi:phage receptor protein (YeeG) [Bacillus subtilis subsp. subtilis]|uniref:YncE family protein n=1 Tax=Bacillus subtilis TaxID=1423 RepID=UPI000A337D2D|nr:hypothetical protein [Bacillus subtilis]MDH3119009.1 hypothetical protein [Bacillus subtilis]OTQ83658.1 phage receptor protein (YeeG) [Bacillus subtilis subsp. subtilis]